VLGIGVWATADDMFSLGFAALAMVLLLIWGFTAYAGGGVPALGAIWHWEQWATLAVGGATLGVMTLVSIHTGAVTWGLAAAVGAGVAALITAAAFIGGRRAG
jgi:transketolase